MSLADILIIEGSLFFLFPGLQYMPCYFFPQPLALCFFSPAPWHLLFFPQTWATQIFTTLLPDPFQGSLMFLNGCAPSLSKFFGIPLVPRLRWNKMGRSGEIEELLIYTGPPPVWVNPISLAYLQQKKGSDPKLQSSFKGIGSLSGLQIGNFIFHHQDECTKI